MRYILCILLVISIGLAQVPKELQKYLASLPKDAKLVENGPQRYRFVTGYFISDPQGKVLNKRRVSANYTRNLPGGERQWNDVRIAVAKSADGPFPEGEKQAYMEGFKYRIGDPGDALKPEFFKGFPPQVIDTKTMVWDVHMFENFGRDYFAELQLNKPYQLSLPEPLGLAGEGSFQHKQVELMWTGLSERDGKACAVIHYRAYFNRLLVDTPGFAMQGRSHYWGDIWVSLQDKQIEYATLSEDVLGQIKKPGGDQVVNVLRDAVFEHTK
jgi:hypothetical protein